MGVVFNRCAAFALVCCHGAHKRTGSLPTPTGGPPTPKESLPTRTGELTAFYLLPRTMNVKDYVKGSSQKQAQASCRPGNSASTSSGGRERNGRFSPLYSDSRDFTDFICKNQSTLQGAVKMPSKETKESCSFHSVFHP